ncbi:hypothetical protein J1605_008511 [Eschrichtius robustus]|uniref:U6 snRNA-associated Sm-like protein LSm4 n=1 Tax=Eschrichtius robustus TaxID=9764 RepID=A0AB34GUM5_ESCRO|nr:hypothetical protein J1605_008511 [Eschrichtius robustus]
MRPGGGGLLFGLVELKNGETYNGHLVSCDNWMNINLREVICTSRDGDKFWRMPECYIRGSTIKYLRIPDEIIDMVKEEVVAKGRGRGGLQQQKQQKGRGMGGAGRAGCWGLPIGGGDCSTWHPSRPSVDILGWCRHGAEGLALSPSYMELGGCDSWGSSAEQLTLLVAACPAAGAQPGEPS